MCELMGMSFAKPVVANVSIQAFGQRSQDNADGWGLAWYPDRSLAMVKQPVRWSAHAMTSTGRNCVPFAPSSVPSSARPRRGC